jgi:hypothetical protein
MRDWHSILHAFLAESSPAILTVQDANKMMDMTDREKALATANVLEMLGLVINRVQGSQDDPRLTTGVLIIEYKADGDYHVSKAGLLNKAITMGALMDALLAFREQTQAQRVTELFDAMLESADIDDEKLN